MINYAIKTNDNGVTVVQSSIKSNNLTHVTEKDIVQFYLKMSQSSFLDTGLLPVDGTGLLAYRQAGNHAQIVVQRSPSINRIIWGRSERDPQAKEYFLAQPYQIYIGDILDDNFYGARIFYSPNPITNPNDPLYHTNLPNTNCKGYRGNGVGWVCLYHTESWNNFPIGEKMARLIERCSGSEAYNDNNMSETDGTRFYQSKYKDKSYLWNPVDWQKKTENDGINWVTDPDIWIPVLVTGIDDQANHNPNGVPLTIGMALTGNYSAYYGDNYLPKPVNAIVRQMTSSNFNVMNLIKKAYVSTNSVLSDIPKAQDPYTYAVEVRKTNVQLLSKSPIKKNQEDEDEDDSEDPQCACCDSTMHPDDIYIIPTGEIYCSDCFNEHYVSLEDGETYPKEDCVWIETLSNWYHANQVTYCDCGTPYKDDIEENFQYKHWCINVNQNTESTLVCVGCYKEHSFSGPDDPKIVECMVTKTSFPSNPIYGFEHYVVPYFDDLGNLVQGYVSAPSYKSIDNWSLITPCPCGKLKNTLGSAQSELVYPASSESLHDLDHAIKIPIKIIDPCVEVGQHLLGTLISSPANNVAENNASCGWACAGCCVYNPGTSEYQWDPQSIDYAVYDPKHLKIIQDTHTKNQKIKNKKDLSFISPEKQI